MEYIGIDIGSTCSKTALMNADKEILDTFVIPTGWSSLEALKDIKKKLTRKGYNFDDMYCISTGYGRQAVEGARRKVTEITCHAKGAYLLYDETVFNIVDIGGQDTKVIACCNGKVMEFYMNDKCSAGTGKFLEIMANRLNVSLTELDNIAREHTEKLQISAMCTVFAESEIVSLIGRGTSKPNIAWGVLQSVVKKVRQEYAKLTDGEKPIFLTGGLCDDEYFLELLSESFGRPVRSHHLARFAGAIGAAALAVDAGENR